MGDISKDSTPQENFSFGDHDLQCLSVYNPFSHDLRSHDGLWIIYIHGGAWRDPAITHLTFSHTISYMEAHSIHSSRITAFASLSYRLTAHPDHPQDGSTPASSLRNAKHPDHLNDVLYGLEYLQNKYGFGDRYLLVGHSCGATLAFQTVMADQILPELPVPAAISHPIALIGVAGIYDLRLLRDRNNHPAYQAFLSGAFGADEEIWDQASPARFSHFGTSWKRGEFAIIVSSTGDELVDVSQITEMESRLSDLKGEEIRVGIWKDLLDMGHDAIWEGNGLGRVIEDALGLILDGRGV